MKQKEPIRSWFFIRRDKKISCIKKSQETGSFLRANQGQHISGNFVTVDIHLERDISESLI